MNLRAAASQIKSIWIKEKSGFPLFLRFIPAGCSCVLNFPQQRLFARPRVIKVRQERRKLAVSGAENADFPIHRCSPPVRFSPIIPEAAGAVNRVSGKKSALRQNVHPPGFPAHRWMNGGGQGCFPAGISAAGRRTDRRSRCIGMKQICAAPYESVLKLCSVEGQATYSPYRVSAFCRPLGRPLRALRRAFASIRNAQTRDCVCRTRIMARRRALMRENSKKCGCKFARFML